MEGLPPQAVSPTTLRCVSCEYDLSGTAVGGLCPECGTAVSTTIEAKLQRSEPPPGSSLAGWSLFLGIIGVCFWPVAPIALGLAIAANQQMKQREYAESAKASATVGGVLGAFGSVILIIDAIGAVLGIKN